MSLLIDIGNTRIKWARLERGVLGPQSAAAHAECSREMLLESMLGTGAAADRVLVGNVGGERLGEQVRAAIKERWDLDAQFVHSTAQAGGVRNAYPEPAKLGVDRWLAMIGAHALEPRALCIVSVGTAMTIDALDARGRHLGGVIVPGPELMASSLLQNTSDIAQRARQGSRRDGLFADNTLGAVMQGAEHALSALVERAVEAMKRELDEAPQVLLTGGAAERLDRALGVSCQVVPDLVLRGLAVLAAESGEASAGEAGVPRV